MVLAVPSSTTKKTVKPTWQEFTAKKEHAPKDIARSVNSGIAYMAVLGKVSVNISMKTQNPTKLGRENIQIKNVTHVSLIIMTRIKLKFMS